MSTPPDWSTFAGIAGVLTVLLLLLARASAGVVTDATRAEVGAGAGAGTGTDPGTGTGTDPGTDEREGEHRHGPASPSGSGSLSTSTSGDAAGGADPASGGSVGGPDTGADTATGTDPDPGTGTGYGVDSAAASRPGDGGTASGRPGRGWRPGGESRADAASRTAPASRGSDQFRDPGQELTTGALLANVAVSQGLFAVLLVAAAWWTGVPASALGVGRDAAAPGVLVAGVALGVGLYVANAAGVVVGERFGLPGGEALREALAPETPGGWLVLLLVVLPLVAGFEELLFRGALIGALSTGFAVSPWLLAAVSSVAFALGHGAQGRIGILVTGLLGFVLAVAFVLTGSLLAVVVAHYLVNALEFVVHEGLDVDWR